MDRDTRSLVRCAGRAPPFLQAPGGAAGPLLLMGSREDVMCRKDLEAEYQHILEILPQARMCLFDMGRIRRWPPTAWQQLMRCGTFSAECLEQIFYLR